MTVPVVLAIAGVVALFLGIWGGGIKAKEVVIPPVPNQARSIVVIIGCLFVGLSIWLSVPASGASPQATATAPSGTAGASQATEAPTQGISPGTILFAENFEDNRGQRMSIGENSKILADETGNKVLEIDNRKGSAYPGIGFGDPTWADYASEFRIRYLGGKSDSMFMEFRRTCDDEQACRRYIVALDEKVVTLYNDLTGKNWTPIESSAYDFKTQSWHFVRVEVNGSNINIYVDNSLLIAAQDSNVKNGSLLIQVNPGAYLEFDDFLVTALGK